MINFNLNKDDGIIYAKSTEEITFAQMIEAQKEVLALEGISKNLLILEDARNAVINLSIEDVKEIQKAVEKNSAKYNFVKHAVVLNSPKGAAFGMWFDEFSLHINYKLKMFHSSEAAKEWLNFINDKR